VEQVFSDLPARLALLVVQVKCVVHCCSQSLLKTVHLNSIFPGSIINVGYLKAVTCQFVLWYFLKNYTSLMSFLCRSDPQTTTTPQRSFPSSSTLFFSNCLNQTQVHRVAATHHIHSYHLLFSSTSLFLTFNAESFLYLYGVQVQSEVADARMCIFGAVSCVILSSTSTSLRSR